MISGKYCLEGNNMELLSSLYPDKAFIEPSWNDDFVWLCKEIKCICIKIFCCRKKNSDSEKPEKKGFTNETLDKVFSSLLDRQLDLKH